MRRATLPRLCRLPRILLGLACVPGSAFAGTTAWNVPAGLWTTSTNWTNGLPVSGASVEFRNGGSALLGPGPSVGGILLLVSSGNLTVSGATLNTSLATLGDSTGSNGQVTVARGGATGQWIAGGSLTVGALGYGSVNIQTANFATSESPVTLGASAGSFGVITVTGSSQISGTWTHSSSAPLTIGNAGSGAVNILNRGLFNGTSSSVVNLGNGATGTGAILVDGFGSTWRASGQTLNLGVAGTGSFSVRNGGSVYSGNLTLGAQVNASGTIVVSGKGSIWESSGTLAIGSAGKGTIRVESGGSISSPLATIGVQGGTGSVVVTGPNSHWKPRQSRLVDGTLTVEKDAFLEGDVILNGPSAILNLGDCAPFYYRIIGEKQGTVNFTNGRSLTFSEGSIQGNLTVNILGGGEVHLQSPALDYLGPTNIIRGSLVLSNVGGPINSAVFVDAAGTLAGSGGTISQVFLAGTLSPGDTTASQPIGTLAATAATLRGGSTYRWQLRDATNPDQTATGWDRFVLGHVLTIDASDESPVTLQISTLSGDINPGAAANFDPTKSYSWALASAEGGVTGFDSSKFVIDATDFQNSDAGTFRVELVGNDLNLVYVPPSTPTPAPPAAPSPAPATKPTIVVNSKSAVTADFDRYKIHGTADSAKGSVRVQYNLNGGGDTAVRNARNWSVLLKLRAGRNVASFRAMDEAGNFSNAKTVVITWHPR